MYSQRKSLEQSNMTWSQFLIIWLCIKGEGRTQLAFLGQNRKSGFHFYLCAEIRGSDLLCTISLMHRTCFHAGLMSRWSPENIWKCSRLTRRAPLVEQELLTPLEYLCSAPVISGVHVTRSLVLCVCFVDRCVSFCPFSFGHFLVCASSICGFWLPLWYLQTLLWRWQH